MPRFKPPRGRLPKNIETNLDEGALLLKDLKTLEEQQRFLRDLAILNQLGWPEDKATQFFKTYFETAKIKESQKELAKLEEQLAKEKAAADAAAAPKDKAAEKQRLEAAIAAGKEKLEAAIHRMTERSYAETTRDLADEGRRAILAVTALETAASKTTTAQGALTRAGLPTVLREIKSDQAGVIADLAEAQAKLLEARAAVLTAASAEADERIAALGARLEKTGAQLEEATQKTTALPAALKRIEERLKALQQKGREQDQELKAAEKALAEAEEAGKADEPPAAGRRGRRGRGTVEADIRTPIEKVTEATEALEKTRTDFNALEARHAELTKELKAAKEDAPALTAEVAALEEELESTRASQEAAEEKTAEAKEKMRAAKAEANKAKAQHDLLDRFDSAKAAVRKLRDAAPLAAEIEALGQKATALLGEDDGELAHLGTDGFAGTDATARTTLQKSVDIAEYFALKAPGTDLGNILDLIRDNPEARLVNNFRRLATAYAKGPHEDKILAEAFRQLAEPVAEGQRVDATHPAAITILTGLDVAKLLEEPDPIEIESAMTEALTQLEHEKAKLAKAEQIIASARSRTGEPTETQRRTVITANTDSRAAKEAIRTHTTTLANEAGARAAAKAAGNLALTAFCIEQLMGDSADRHPAAPASYYLGLLRQTLLALNIDSKPLGTTKLTSLRRAITGQHAEAMNAALEALLAAKNTHELARVFRDHAQGLAHLENLIATRPELRGPEFLMSDDDDPLWRRFPQDYTQYASPAGWPNLGAEAPAAGSTRQALAALASVRPEQMLALETIHHEMRKEGAAARARANLEQLQKDAVELTAIAEWEEEAPETFTELRGRLTSLSTGSTAEAAERFGDELFLDADQQPLQPTKTLCALAQQQGGLATQADTITAADEQRHKAVTAPAGRGGDPLTDLQTAATNVIAQYTEGSAVDQALEALEAEEEEHPGAVTRARTALRATGTELQREVPATLDDIAKETLGDDFVPPTTFDHAAHELGDLGILLTVEIVAYRKAMNELRPKIKAAEEAGAEIDSKTLREAESLRQHAATLRSHVQTLQAFKPVYDGILELKAERPEAPGLLARAQAAVTRAPKFDAIKQMNDETFPTLVDQLQRRVHFAAHLAISGQLFQDQLSQLNNALSTLKTLEQHLREEHHDTHTAMIELRDFVRDNAQALGLTTEQLQYLTNQYTNKNLAEEKYQKEFLATIDKMFEVKPAEVDQARVAQILNRAKTFLDRFGEDAEEAKGAFSRSDARMLSILIAELQTHQQALQAQPENRSNRELLAGIDRVLADYHHLGLDVFTGLDARTAFVDTTSTSEEAGVGETIISGQASQKALIKLDDTELAKLRTGQPVPVRLRGYEENHEVQMHLSCPTKSGYIHDTQVRVIVKNTDNADEQKRRLKDGAKLAVENIDPAEGFTIRAPNAEKARLAAEELARALLDKNFGPALVRVDLGAHQDMWAEAITKAYAKREQEAEAEAAREATRRLGASIAGGEESEESEKQGESTPPPSAASGR